MFGSKMFKRNIRFIKAVPNGDKTKYWSKQAKVVKKLRARTYLLKSGSKMFKRNIRFIKAAPNGQDMDPPNITQAIKEENDCRPKSSGFKSHWRSNDKKSDEVRSSPNGSKPKTSLNQVKALKTPLPTIWRGCNGRANAHAPTQSLSQCVYARHAVNTWWPSLYLL